MPLTTPQVQWTNNIQRTESDATIQAQKEANRFHEGKENSHLANDSSMSRTTNRT
jgi:hypothetical protein